MLSSVLLSASRPDATCAADDLASWTNDFMAGELKNCVKTKETTPLEPDVGHMHYAPGVGLVQDAGLALMQFGFTKKVSSNSFCECQAA